MIVTGSMVNHIIAILLLDYANYIVIEGVPGKRP